MKRDQAEKIIRSVRRTCRGHPLLSYAERRKYIVRWQAAERAGNFGLALRLKGSLDKRFRLNHRREVTCQNWENLLQQTAKLITAHTEDCGYDFNDTVVAGPWDGKEHDYQCPHCGVEGGYRAPLFENLE